MKNVPLAERAEPVVVRPAVLADIAYIVALGDRHFEAIGFIPAAAYRWTLGAGPDPRWRRYGLWVALVNADCVGFVFASPGPVGGTAHITQICVQEDARRNEYASALVHVVEAWSGDRQRSGVGLRVATDLEATVFWEALGYGLRQIESGGRSRGRVIERRYRALSCGLFVRDVAEAVFP